MVTKLVLINTSGFQTGVVDHSRKLVVNDIIEQILSMEKSWVALFKHREFRVRANERVVRILLLPPTASISVTLEPLQRCACAVTNI